MYILFDLFFLLYIVFYLPILLLRGKWHNGFGERFGFFSEGKRRALGERKNIWVHAVSVGEVMAIDPLLRRLQAEYSGRKIVLSVTTKTGHALAQKRYGEDVLVLWAPLDLSWTVRAFVSAIRPVCYIAAETELWPNLFRRLDQESVAILVVNGRISDEAFPKYRLVKRLLRGTLKRVRLFCMQSVLDQERILALGARPENVKMVGNVKFDQVHIAARQEGYRDLVTGGQVILGASTHPGEEELLLNIFLNERVRYPDLRLILVPRHPERAKSVCGLVEKAGLSPVLFSDGIRCLGREDVLIVDTIGHLAGLYSVVTIVVVGKSFTVQGGHNIIEPALWGKPVIIGPYMQNFRDIVRVFLEEEAVVQLAGPSALGPKIRELLEDTQKREVLGSRAESVVHRNRGATDRTMALVREILS